DVFLLSSLSAEKEEKYRSPPPSMREDGTVIQLLSSLQAKRLKHGVLPRVAPDGRRCGRPRAMPPATLSAIRHAAKERTNLSPGQLLALAWLGGRRGRQRRCGPKHRGREVRRPRASSHPGTTVKHAGGRDKTGGCPIGRCEGVLVVAKACVAHWQGE